MSMILFLVEGKSHLRARSKKKLLRGGIAGCGLQTCTATNSRSEIEDNQDKKGALIQLWRGNAIWRKGK
jgi:hypothetical protein